MSKAKKQAKPQIDPRVVTRPRLDALFDRHARGELDLDGLQAGVQALMTEVGTPPVLDALVKRMEDTPEAERETLMLLVPRLKSREVIDYLWQLVKKPRAMTMDAKVTALVILKAMDEEVDLSDPSLYVSPRDLKASDVKTLQGLFGQGVRGLARGLRAARDPAEVEAYMHRINTMPDRVTDIEEMLLETVKSAEEGATDLEADFLFALAHTTPFAQVQQAAEQALARLEKAGVKPVTAAILGLGQDKFYAAYMTDPDHPWQQSVTVAWERSGGAIQALSFLLDFGVPWRGAIKDMFPTYGMTPQQFQRDFVERAAQQMDLRLYRVSLARAQATIAAAVEANRKYNIPLPKEYIEVRHLVERWVLHPPAWVIENDSTRDELSHLPLVPDRSGKPLMMDVRDLQAARDRGLFGQGKDLDEEVEQEEDLEAEEVSEEWEDEFDQISSFEDVLGHVRNTCAEVAEGLPWWKPEWVSDYLTSLSPDPHWLERHDEELEFIIDQWWELHEFIYWLDEHDYEFHALDDLRGFHFSEYLKEEADMDDDRGVSRAEALHNFFTYLAQRGAIPSNLSFLTELAQMLAQPNVVTHRARPEARGGEIALWFRVFGDTERNEPFTYNEWWMALVLERRFKRDWGKCERETAKKPDAAAKRALLARLRNRLKEEPDYLDDLEFERPTTPADYRRAEKWYDRESVSDARAW